MEAFRSRLTIRRTQVAGVARGAGIADVASYWIVLAGIYILQGALWYYPFKAKLFDDNASAPASIQKQFSGTIIDSVPGVDAAWVILGLLQGLVCATLVLSLASREFMPDRRKPWLLGGLGLAMLITALMLFGQSLTAQFESVAQLYVYFAGTVVILVLVLLMPPYRPAAWLSSLGGRGESAE